MVGRAWSGIFWRGHKSELLILLKIFLTRDAVMREWKDLIEREKLTDHELRRIPCMHQHVVEAISDYFQTAFGMPALEIMRLFYQVAGNHPRKQHWISAYDFEQYLDGLFRQTPGLIKPDACYQVAKTFLSKNVTPYKYYLQKMPARLALHGMEQLGNTCHHAMPVEVTFPRADSLLIKITPYPYYRDITKGTFCHFIRGVTDAIFSYRKIRVNKVKESFCSVDLKTLITKVYARLNWTHAEDSRWVYLNDQPLAEKITLTHPSSIQPISAARIIKDVNHDGLLLFKKGELYNAPFCCLEGACPNEGRGETDKLHRRMLEKTIMDMRENEIIIFNHEAAKASGHGQEGRDDEPSVRSQINKAIDFIQQHYSQKITLQQAAQQAAMSPTHFKRLFKLQTGKTMAQYLLQHRLEKAREILRTDDQSLTRIAVQCGFATAAYFGYWFKKHFNVTPKEYQKAVKNGLIST